MSEDSTLGQFRTWFGYRHLLFHLVASDLRSRYRRTYLGILWAIVWPMLFSFIFSFLAVNIFDVPLSTYIAYVVTGFVIWDFIAGSINGGTVSFQAAEGYLKQVRLPLILFPMRTVTFLAANFMFGTIAAAVVIAATTPSSISWTWIFWPLSLLMTYILALPLATISAIANLKYRDYSHAVSLIVFLMWYLSPALIAREVYEKENLKLFTDLNPFASLIDIFRDPMLNGLAPSQHDILLVLFYSAALWTISLAWLAAERKRLVFYL
ncbi:MAG: ABC transporter permease [Acidobacteria bacterium]|nr:ABC transporter permease [Acidobacteriota bacterium]